MQGIRSFVNRLLTPQGFALLFFIHFAVSMGLFLVGAPHQLTSNGFDLLDNRVGYGADDILSTWTAYGEKCRTIYQSFLLYADILYSILTGVLSIAALNVIRSSLPRLNLGGWIFSFPIIMVALDFLENALLLSMLVNFPNISVSIAGIAGNLTSVKLALVNVSFLLILLAWVLLILNWWNSHNSKKRPENTGTRE